MFRFTTLTISVLLLCLVAVSAQASPLEIVLPMGEPVEYQRSLTDTYESSSLVTIYVENVPDPLRWKDWRIEIWLPANTAPAQLTINVDYGNTQNYSDPPIEIFPVTLANHPGPPIWAFLPKGFYADTREPAWEQYGTVPVNQPGLHPWGNPWWVSFHLNLPNGPFGLSIFDECIPEPATLGLLLLGGLALLRRRRSA